MKRLTGLSALALIIAGTSGCGWIYGENGYFRDRGSDYLEARQTATMQMPPNVDAKRIDPLLPVPQQVATTTDTGEFTKCRARKPWPWPVMLPASSACRRAVNRAGLWRSAVPAEVWPVARQFFADNGFQIAEERPQTGEFSTAWQRFDALSPNPWRVA